MNPLRALLAALTPEIEDHDTRMRAVGTSLKALRSEVRSLHQAAAAVAARTAAVSRQMAQLRQLRAGGDAAARLDDLAVRLVADRVSLHLRAAVERAPRRDQPVPNLTIDAFWPADVHPVVVDAVPDAVFFDNVGPGADTLRVPPRLAPAPAIALWTLVAELIAEVVVPAAAARFGDLVAAPLDITPGRLVRRAPGSIPPGSTAKPWQQGRLAIDLTSNTASVTIGAGAGDAVPCELAYELWFGSKPA